MIRINLILENEIEKRFLKIKSRTGIENHPDVIRFLINRRYEEEKRETLPGT